MFTGIYRLIKYAFQHFWRQRLLSAATLVVILLVLMVFQSIIVFGAIGEAALESIREKIDIAVFFERNVSEDEVLSIKEDLEGLDVVELVTYISRDQAEVEFRQRYEGEDFVKALDELDENPLSASLKIKTFETEQIPVIATYLGNVVPEEKVSAVSYNENNKQVIDRLTAIVRASEAAGLILGLFLAIVAVLVAFNTVLLGIYSNRDEISIMRLVGAPNYFIRGPFIALGIIYGFLSATLVMLVTIPVIHLIAPTVTLFVPGMDLVAYFWTSFGWLYLAQVFAGGAIGVLSSAIAISRYLDV
ncbi:MAG: hypothetical protein COT88_00220 [Candidatus Colwellbacteria bacterium CG10_big_fil_rev_8_21_14_0_10_41_28]|uniref:Cell division protein FtsX n=1 Tax=Candidatus Colwellbacteria bacterium CG10_big_fil_rev_8_21_14_0_10_41_28 TaxID=1974539 RepID=A0A2H0VHY1_9BACT|nr:MAG: hypothetical protein COT88_00220 [Candidatus Colwellbacteria bacterium CG10_big_fil_rev_8_21_14_0_10_41_28]